MIRGHENVQNAPQSAPAKAILDAFGSALDILGDQNHPGIRAVTEALSQIINRLKVSQVDEGWQQSAEKMERLSFLIRKIVKYPEAAQHVEEICSQLKDQLVKLAKDIDRAARYNRRPSDLLNSPAVVTMLDNFIKGLTGAIFSSTSETKTKLGKAFQVEVSEISGEILKNGNAFGLILRMKNNTIGKVEGSFDANNITYDNAVMNRVLLNNQIGSVDGDMFSGNIAGASHK